MFGSESPRLVAFGLLAATIVGAVSLSAGYITGSLLHPPQVTFNDRWPERPIAQLDPDATKAMIQRYRG